MAISFDGKLVVAISSRALFDFEEENQVFEKKGDRVYMELQLARLEDCAKRGVAFPLVQKLLAFNTEDTHRVEVVILSKNDPVSGLRVFRSAKQSGLKLERGVFTRGRNAYRYLEALHANLFLSANEEDVRGAIAAHFPAARVIPESAQAAARHSDEVRIAFDGDAVLFSDEAEQVRTIQALARGAAQASDRRICSADAHPYRARNGPQRTRARAGRANTNELEYRRGRSDVSRGAGQERVPYGLPARHLFRRPARTRGICAETRSDWSCAVRRG
jgi:5'-nucleotidase